MTPQEFKSWFDGFTEALTGVPTKAQWARIKERVGEIDGKPVTERVFVDRYYPTYPPRYWGPYWATYSANAAGGLSNSVGSNSVLNCNATGMDLAAAKYQNNVAFNSAGAMADLGRADAKALAA